MKKYKDEIIKKIMDAELKNNYINVNLNNTKLPYKYVAFIKSYNNKEYYWIAAYDYKKSGMVGYYQPLRSQNFVKAWKTLKGTKKNFIKTCIR